MTNLLYALIPLLPFVAFVILGLGGNWIRERAHLVAVPAVLTSFLFSVLVFIEVAGGSHFSAGRQNIDKVFAFLARHRK